jgi:23S rRNA pseudouridine1911/1915/1917 synthase
MKINILYEDNHLIVVEKPVNIPVQEDASKDKDLLTLVKEDIKFRYNKPGNVYLGLIHRLDRPVGGAIVFAKTSKAASRMANLLRKREINRTYLAVVRGYVKKERQTLRHYLYKDRKKNIVSVTSPQFSGAKEAILHYEVLSRKNDLTLLHVTLETGRSHQIRVQLSEIGHPLFGDQKYGKGKNKHGEQIALWSHSLSFVHPVRKININVTSIPSPNYPWDLWIQQDRINY